MTVVCGVDEAGRGPVIGPMVLACAVFDSGGRRRLKGLKIRDSKKMSASKRVEAEPVIKELALEWRILHIQPVEIDRLRKRLSLNAIEAYKTAELLMSLETPPTRIILDAVDPVAESYLHRVTSSIASINPEFRLPEMLAEHKADDRHIEVSAASVLAKVERDRCIDALKEEYGELGSGYPSDEVTQDFVRRMIRCGDVPGFIRRSWCTFDRSKQTFLNEY